MKNTFAMNILYCFEQFIHVVFNFLGMQVFISHQILVEILFHKFEHKCKFTYITTKVPVGSS